MFFKREKKFSEYNASIVNLIARLNEVFPIDYTKSCFELYPFSNESRYSTVLDKLNATELTVKKGKIKIALLFGESNFLSMLPELSKKADLIVLSDIEPKLHQHTQHLLDCIYKSNSPNEFIKNYAINNPIENTKTYECFDNGYNSVLTMSALINMLTGKRGCIADSLKHYHFLSSLERFKACKEAATKLLFTRINLNLLDECECKQLASILKKSNAILTLINFTNIHDYDEHNKRYSTVRLLLERLDNCFFMYSTNKGVNTNITNEIEDYFKAIDIKKVSINISVDDLIPCHNIKPPPPIDSRIESKF